MQIDFTKVSDEPTTFELLQEGSYYVTVSDCQEKESSKGNPYWAITFLTEEGNKIFDNLVFTENTFNRVKKMFKNLGLNVNGTFDYSPEDILGLNMTAKVLIEEYTDKSGNLKQKNVIDVWESSACDNAETPLLNPDEIPF